MARRAMTTTALNVLKPRRRSPIKIRRASGPSRPRSLTGVGINGKPARRWQRSDGR
jgi:hypothetical protein